MRRTLVALLAIGLVAGACTDEPDETTTTSAAETTTTTETAETTTTTEDDQATTTTAPVGASTEPAYVAVRLDNGPGAAQVNLDPAEIVLETMVEGGITRLTALYRDDVPTVAGPVRSLRPVDADLLAPFRPVVVTSGGQPFVRQAVDAAGIVVLGPESGVLTDTGNQPPNQLATNPEAIAQFADLGDPPRPFGDASPPTDGEDAGEWSIELGPEARTVAWEWSGDEWLRSQDGSTHESLVGGEEFLAVTTDVVLVLFANERSAGYVDTAGSPVFDYDVIGGGEFLLAADGALATGTWRRDSLVDDWELTADDGTVVGLPDGRLWVMVAPDVSTVERP